MVIKNLPSEILRVIKKTETGFLSMDYARILKGRAIEQRIFDIVLFLYSIKIGGKSSKKIIPVKINFFRLILFFVIELIILPLRPNLNDKYI
jgi:hypothetical protein